MISSDSGFWIDIFILLLVLVVGLLWLLWFKWGYKHMDHPIDHHLGRHNFCSPQACSVVAEVYRELLWQCEIEENNRARLLEAKQIQADFEMRRCRASRDNERWG